MPAYRHIMAVLQDVSSSSLPLASHLISLDKKIGIPRYALLKRFYDLSLQSPTVKGEPPKCPVDITKLFPPYPEMGLDETQYRALQRILSRKVSIVQGTVLFMFHYSINLFFFSLSLILH